MKKHLFLFLIQSNIKYVLKYLINKVLVKVNGNTICL